MGRADPGDQGWRRHLVRAWRKALARSGSEDDNEMQQPPKDLACALSMFADAVESLKKSVEKTPKHVVSAAVIDEVNVVLELARIIRTLIPNP